LHLLNERFARRKGKGTADGNIKRWES